METAKCGRCQKDKPISEFYKRTARRDRPSTYCKECFHTYTMARWRERKRKAVQLLGGQCQSCGYRKCLNALEFHHLDPSKKDDAVGFLGQRRAWGIFMAELEKCILLCANCHREFHSLEENFVIEPTGENPRLNNPKIVPSPEVEIAIKTLVEKTKTSSRLLPTGLCSQCESPVYGTKYCSVLCAKSSKRKVVRPTVEKLKKEIETMSFCAIGRKYGVSDNAVRKWARLYGIAS